MNTTSLVEISSKEQELAKRVDSRVTGGLEVSGRAGGLAFRTATEAMEFAKLMALSHVAVPKHLRGNPGACLAVTIQAVEWGMSPYAVANKSYSVNDRLSYESQLVQAVILKRAPIKGRFGVEYSGDGGKRRCHVSAVLADGSGVVEYVSPEFDKITPKNSPLWKSDPDQQQFYYSGRALCRRHFPDVLLGIYDRDEIEPAGPESARDVTPPRSLAERMDALAAGPAEDAATEQSEPEPESEVMHTAETQEDNVGDTGPAGAPQNASGEPQAEPPERTEPQTAEEYIGDAERWILSATDAADAEARWRNEKQLRSRLGVSVDDAKTLAEKLTARCKAIR